MSTVHRDLYRLHRLRGSLRDKQMANEKLGTPNKSFEGSILGVPREEGHT